LNKGDQAVNVNCQKNPWKFRCGQRPEIACREKEKKKNRRGVGGWGRGRRARERNELVVRAKR